MSSLAGTGLVACMWQVTPQMATCKGETEVKDTPQDTARLSCVKDAIQPAKSRATRVWRAMWRGTYITRLFVPLVLTYPLSRLSDGCREWWLGLCLWTAEASGAIVIKLMQWASSRPDLFGADFCEIFKRLQDNTHPHAWSATQKILREQFGEDWEEKLQLDPRVIGSGCIAQVYRGRVTLKGGEKWGQEVAVKVQSVYVRAAKQCTHARDAVCYMMYLGDASVRAREHRR
jgi:hypothetical protein